MPTDKGGLVTRKTLAGRLLALLVALMLIAAACGSDSDSGDESSSDTTGGSSEDTAAPETQAGGEFIDLGTFVGDPPEHIDPALNVTLDAYQVINALYDGNECFHVALVKTSGVLKMFCRGIPVYSGSCTLAFGVAAKALRIGAREPIATEPPSFRIKAVRFSDSARYTGFFIP